VELSTMSLHEPMNRKIDCSEISASMVNKVMAISDQRDKKG